jgi:hypothetical protein
MGAACFDHAIRGGVAVELCTLGSAIPIDAGRATTLL